jgi:hypothetical protein
MKIYIFRTSILENVILTSFTAYLNCNKLKFNDNEADNTLDLHTFIHTSTNLQVWP